MIPRFIARAAVFGMASALAAAVSAAVTLPKEGTYDAISCWSGVSSEITPAKGYTASSYEMTGTIMSKTPGGLGDNSSFRCVGMSTSFNGKPGGGNVCETVDADGDKRVNQFMIGADGKVTREIVTGTGKYEGMTAVSSVSMFPAFPVIKAGTFQGCNHQTGSYKLK